MKNNNGTYLYIGLISVFVLTIGGIIIYNTTREKTNVKPLFRPSPKQIDYSIFDSKDSVGSGMCMDNGLIEKLELLEKRTGYPIFRWINSAARTPYWNKIVGGTRNSSHLIPLCMAVDIKALNRGIRDTLVIEAKNVGFKRIGVAKTFVHLDVDPTKTQNIAWGYPAGTAPEINPFK